MKFFRVNIYFVKRQEIYLKRRIREEVYLDQEIREGSLLR
jgi:hypothetical protein